MLHRDHMDAHVMSLRRAILDYLEKWHVTQNVNDGSNVATNTVPSKCANIHGCACHHHQFMYAKPGPDLSTYNMS